MFSEICEKSELGISGFEQNIAHWKKLNMQSVAHRFLTDPGCLESIVLLLASIYLSASSFELNIKNWPYCRFFKKASYVLV